MKSTPKTPKRVPSAKDQGNQLDELIKDIVPFKDSPAEVRGEEASKPIYLTRYE